MIRGHFDLGNETGGIAALVNLGSRYGLTLSGWRRLAAAGIDPSVGRVGDSYDNAIAKTLNGLYKAEVI
ncbi:transposase InsO family protein [Rhodoblastus acidophilus]|nr:transposase InsO family protein [Rhodoblastus acidophilus]MCW2333465.1 transposase InsO family protein [Rhodoblastus acidophilus]